MTGWFSVDKAGLAKLMERRGKGWVLAELLQNAWDAPGVGSVSVRVAASGRGLTTIVVEDDSPDGFADLRHAFTLFARSVKLGDPEKRGRFNFGEKLVLACAREATITSTAGGVTFTADGERKMLRSRTEGGSVFSAVVYMTKAEAEEAIAAAFTFIPPDGISTTINGVLLERPAELRSFYVTLPTLIANDEGVLRPTRRLTEVAIYSRRGEVGRIFEMGIPVCETDDDFDIDVGQKVPLSLERDGVTPAYLRELRAAVLSNANDVVLAAGAASNAWVNDALEHPDVASAAVEDILTARFGEKRVVFDPSDREANDRAAAAGYTVIPGRTFSKGAWENVRGTGVLPAGQVTPTPKPFSPDGDPAEHVEETEAMARYAEFCRALAREVLGHDIQVSFLKTFNATAAYGGRHLCFNVGRLGKRYFEGPLTEKKLSLIIHEFGHDRAANHFSTDYNDALTDIGAAVAFLALRSPRLFHFETVMEETA
jgi:hypothetical protein